MSAVNIAPAKKSADREVLNNDVEGDGQSSYAREPTREIVVDEDGFEVGEFDVKTSPARNDLAIETTGEPMQVRNSLDHVVQD